MLFCRGRVRVGQCRLLVVRVRRTTLLSTSSSSSSSSSNVDCEDSFATAEVKVEYRGGLPLVTVPLPSRRELCRFTLRPVSNTVGDFLNMLRHEDHGIDRVTVSTKDGVRIASSNTIESLMGEDFKLLVNDKEYLVRPPDREKISKEDVKRLSDVRSLVNQLYEALNVEEHQVKKERELLGKLEELRIALEPMEKKREQLESVATRRTNALTWVGLGLMSVQFGILARLTWWEYSWDIMEPVTYFVTYGTAMAAYAYFVLTKQEYLLPEVRDRQHLIILHKKARKIGLDIDQYNTLKDEVARIETDLARLRDPIKVHHPPTHVSHFELKTVSPLDRLKSIINKARFK